MNYAITDRQSLLDAVLRSDFYSFLQAAFPVISGENRLLLNWHLEAITAALMKVSAGETKRLIITVPPRSLKSICASVAYPAFVLGKDPSRRIICVSYAEALARKHANDFRALMRSSLYRRLFPGTRISSAKDTELEVMTTARGFRLTTSVGGTLTGRGGNLIIIDDPMKPQDAQSETTRENVLQWYANTLLSRLDNKGEDAIIVVMQRLHPEDLVGHLLEQGGWTHLNLPAIAECEQVVPLGEGHTYRRSSGSALHPERESLAALKELKTAMGSLDYAAQYQQEPVPLGGNLVKWSWFGTYGSLPVAQPRDQIIVSWDTALSANELADYSACVVLLVKGETVYVLDVFRARLEYPELKRKVIEFHRRWRRQVGTYALIIEDKGSGMSLIQDLKRDNIHAIGILPEGDKVIRMSAQTAPIEAGAVLLPAQAAWIEEFRREILAFPLGRHNDQVDAFSQALKRAFAPKPRQAVYGRY